MPQPAISKRVPKPQSQLHPVGAKISDWLQGYLDRYEKASPDEKAAIIQQIGAMVGGLAGTAIPGGTVPGRLVGAGIGGALGHYVGGMAAESATGVPTPPFAKQIKGAMQEGATQAAFQGAGEAIPIAGKLISKAVKTPFTPTKAAEDLMKLAEQYDIKLDLAQTTGRTGPRLLYSAVELNPLSTGIVRRAGKKFTDRLEKVIRENISEWSEIGEHVPKMEEAFAKAQRGYRADIERLMADVKKKLNLPANAKSARDVGEALEKGNKDIRSIASEWYRLRLKDLEGEIGNVEIPIEKISAGFEGVSESAEKLMMPKVRAILDRVAKAKGVEPQAVPQSFDDYVMAEFRQTPAERKAYLAEWPGEYEKLEKAYQQVAAAGSAPSVVKPTGISFKEYGDIRQQLTEYLAKLQPREHNQERRAISTLIDSLDDAFEGAVGKDQAGKLREMRTKYRDTMRKATESRHREEPGNIVAKRLYSETPEAVAKQDIFRPADQTIAEHAVAASTPGSLAPEMLKETGRVMEDPMSTYASGILGEATEKASIPGSTGVTDYVSAKALNANLPPHVRNVFLRGAEQEVANLTAPIMQGQEHYLFRSPLASVMKKREELPILKEAFPPTGPGPAADAMDLFKSQGAEDAAKQAYMSDIMGRRALGINAGSEDAQKILNYQKILDAARGEGGTMSQVLGPAQRDELIRIAQGGVEGEASNKLFRNMSNTARAQALQNIIAGTVGLGLAGAYQFDEAKPYVKTLAPLAIGGPVLAKLMTSPKVSTAVAKWAGTKTPIMTPQTLAGKAFGPAGVVFGNLQSGNFGRKYPEAAPQEVLEVDPNDLILDDVDPNDLIGGLPPKKRELPPMMRYKR
jgi:hypothetical protein